MTKNSSTYQTQTVEAVKAPAQSSQTADKTHLFFLHFPPEREPAPLLIYFPGLDETGKELISLEMDAFSQDCDVCGLVIPSEDLDDWDKLAAAAIGLVRDEIAKRPANTPVYLCAESFGGCLGIRVLEQAPDLFDRVVLVNPASSFHRVPWLASGSLLLSLVPAFVFDQPSDWLVFFLAPLHRISDKAYRALAESTRAAPKETLLRRLALMRAFSIQTEKLRQVRYPVLLVGSAGDRILPSVEETQRLAQIFPNAQAVTLPYSGHACLVEDDVNLEELISAHHFMPRLDT